MHHFNQFENWMDHFVTPYYPGSKEGFVDFELDGCFLIRILYVWI